MNIYVATYEDYKDLINPDYVAPIFDLTELDHTPIPGPDHDSDTIDLIREKVTLSWQAAEERKRDLILRNKTSHKQTMIERWQNPTDKMLATEYKGRPKGAKDLKQREKRPEKKIYIQGIIYDNAFVAAKEFGLHPVNIRRRCRLDSYSDWYYV